MLSRRLSLNIFLDAAAVAAATAAAAEALGTSHGCHYYGWG